MSAAAHASQSDEVSGLLTASRSPLQHLLHALNQPLTGLHCSLELALIGQRTPEQYVRTLREGLELAERMTVLVGAIRELVGAEQEQQAAAETGAGTGKREVLALDALLRETVEELHLVAEAKQVRILLQSDVTLPVHAARPALAGAVFRVLDSALSLTRPGGLLRMVAHAESGQAWVEVRWEAGLEAVEHAAFSPPELGLVLAEAGWKRLGGEWLRKHSRHETGCLHTVLARLPLAGNCAATRACLGGNSQ
ncbi:MAG TPA: hypothetical protein VKR57_12135 [Terriglobales bacterium]|nr:hypothetical protein [Terriglobales bacterium]